MRAGSLFGSCLCHILLLPSPLAAAPDAPTPELLLYLADWETDARGRPIDPMELPADLPPAVPPDISRQPPGSASPPPADTDPMRASTPEYPR